jgi:WD40 repeat protein
MAPLRLSISVTLAISFFAGCSSRPVGRFAGHKGLVIAATFSADGKLLGSLGEDGTVRVWDVTTRRELARVPFQSPPRLYTTSEVAFSPNGRSLGFAGRANAVHLWTWQQDEPPQKLFALAGIPSVVAFSADGTRLLAASGGYGPAMTRARPQRPVVQPLDLRVFDLREGRVTHEIRDHGCTPLSVAIAPDGTRFAVACLSVDGKPVRDLPATGNVEAQLTVRDLVSGEELAHIDGEGNPLMSFTADGSHLLVGSRVRNASTGKLVREVEGHPRVLVDDGRRVLVLQQGFGMPWDIGFATTPWIRANRVDLKTGRVFKGRQVALKDRALSLLPPLSPDGHFFVDYSLNLWRLDW